jgi:acid phosphatase family membrane protein YuiD
MMTDFFSKLFLNEPLMTALVAWVLAALLKFAIVALHTGKLDWERILGTGGMPSTHITPVVACTTSIGIITGYDSAIFALAVVFTIVVGYDAAGIRRHAGEQALAINSLINDLTQLETFKGQKLESFFKRWDISELNTLLGHNPLEVAVGVIMGILIAILIHIFYGHLFVQV